MIREATTEDIAAIAALHLASMQELQGLLPQGFGEGFAEAVTVEDIAGEFAEALGDEDYICIVACADNGELLGFCRAFVESYSDDLLSAPYLTIEYVEVAGSARGMGLGAKLLERIEQIAAERSIDCLELRVWQGNMAAIALYGKCGFSAIETRMAKRIG
jgi:ribosomal protein S18 acetylase RimI-like enzyme